MAKRMPKHITNKSDLDFIFSLTDKDLQKLSVIMEMFGTFGGKRRFNPYDTITVPKYKYGTDELSNTEAFDTTVGLYVFNKFFIEPEPAILGVLGYIQEPITKKMYGKINKKISYAVAENEVTVEQLKLFLDKQQKYQPYVEILSANHTDAMLLIGPKINARKKQLLKQYDKEIKARDGKTVSIIEKELLDYARELLKDDPSMDMYNSGAIGSFENNFKNMYIMKGAVLDPNDPEGGYNIITSNYMDGISKEEYAKFANGLAAGPYARSRKTASGGYMEKLFLRAFGHVSLDEPGSDCGTKRYIEVFMDDDNLDDFMYSYIIQSNGSLIELTSKNRDQFKGKTVKLRYSAMCENKDHICNKCAGNLFYRIGDIRRVGAATPQFASRIKLTFMKAFHDSVVQYAEMDVEDAFGYKDK